MNNYCRYCQRQISRQKDLREHEDFKCFQRPSLRFPSPPPQSDSTSGDEADLGVAEPYSDPSDRSAAGDEQEEDPASIQLPQTSATPGVVRGWAGFLEGRWERLSAYSTAVFLLFLFWELSNMVSCGAMDTLFVSLTLLLSPLSRIHPESAPFFGIFPKSLAALKSRLHVSSASRRYAVCSLCYTV